MSHFSALISLKHTIRRINYLSRASISPSFPLVDFLFTAVVSLQDFLYPIMGFNPRVFMYGRNWNYLDEELRDVTWKLEDVLESQMSHQLQSNLLRLGSDEDTNYNLLIDFTEVAQEIIIFIETVIRIKEPYLRLSRSLALQQAAVSAYSSRTGFFLDDSSELVGMRDEIDKIKHQLSGDERERLVVIKIVGMSGIGKTALAKAVAEDPEVLNCFDCHVFVPIGQDYQSKEVLSCILSQLNHEINGDDDDNNIMSYDETILQAWVNIMLQDKRYIILFDDVWDEDFSSNLLPFLPDNLHGSRVMLTTRLSSVATDISGISLYELNKQFMDKEDSWDLLRKKVFATDSCPYRLKKLGKKIAEKCEGLPLAIISVGNHLAKTEKTVEYWESVVEKGIASIITADDEIFKVLHPSYEYLPLYLKAPFLYLGVFPQCREISASQIVKLWIAEGFLEVVLRFEYWEEDLRARLGTIQRHNLVITKQHRFLSYRMRVKTFSLHIVYWCYCKTQARKEKLFQILNTIEDSSAEDTKSQRRLCIHNNSLFGMKDSRDSLASVLKIRSLLCTGPYHKYPVPVSLGLKLLRVLDAVAIRFYEFPYEVVNLVLLRYLTFTFDGSLPASISQLTSLEFLIVRRHIRIIYPSCPSYMPLEIWDMKELRHLQVEGSDLPEPPHQGTELPNLLKLLDVTPQSCTKRVLDKIPNLMKLGVQIVLPVNAAEEPLYSLDYLRELNKLKSFKCVIVNPKPSSQVAARAYPTSIFPEGLEKLSLSGFGYSWEQMSNISRLANLKKLKLRHCAFQGSTWVVREGEFSNVRFLLLEDIDLRHWNTDLKSCDGLTHLIIRHCYNLERITKKEWNFLEAIEIVDCKPSLVDSAKSLYSTWFGTSTTVSVVSSWEEDSRK